VRSTGIAFTPRPENEREETMLELYHNINSVCAQKVRIALAEKGQKVTEHLLTLQGDQNDLAYMQLNPDGVVPTLVHDGNVVIESSLIIQSRLSAGKPQVSELARWLIAEANCNAG
jgi:hypothetical protein